jgi:tRNA pseudouridine13 synthase
MQAHALEKAVGIETYLTNTPAVNGKLRTKIEDFLVEEISPDGTILRSLTYNQPQPTTHLDLTQIPPNRYTYNLVLEKYNLETFASIQKLAAHLEVPYRNIGFAGLKDKRAVTTQRISISGADPQKLLNMPEFGFYFNRIQLGKPIKLGDLNGNHFNIIIRQMDGPFDLVQKCLGTLKEQILSISLPNFYGQQRFGAIRPISHKVGQVLLHGDYETALKIYLTESLQQEPEKINDIRARIQDSWPLFEEIFPTKYYYENKIIHNLKKFFPNHKKTFKKVFPFRYELLFIHAYQSYLFNRMLSHRLKNQLPLEHALEGDWVALLDTYSLPTRATYKATSHNLNSLNNAIDHSKAVVLFPLFGFDLDYSNHPQADYISGLIEKEAIELSLFKFPTNPKLNFKTVYRPIAFKPKNFEFALIETNHHAEDFYIQLKFSINKGCYATVVLREFMKTTPLNY